MSTAGSPLDKIKEQYFNCMHLSADDSYVIDGIIATLTGTFHPGCSEPVWLWIIGPPGSGKTECIRSLENYPFCTFISSLTENALLSGYSDDSGNDPSLVPLLDGKVLVIKDATALMSDPKRMQKNAGDLRDCFDGSCAKPSGKAGLRSYKSSFGILACITDEIDSFMEQYQQLGERFLSIRLHRRPLYLKERVDYLHQVRATMKDKLIWQKQLRDVVTEQLSKIKQNVINRSLPDSSDIDHEILLVADVVSLLRSTTVQGNASTPELSTRISQQLLNITLARAFADNKDKLDERDVNFARRIAVDTLPGARLQVASLLYRNHWTLRGADSGFTISGIQRKLSGITTAAIASMMVQYAHIGLVQRMRVRKGVYQFRISDDAYDYLKDSQLLEQGKHQRPCTQDIEIIEEGAANYN